MAQAMEGRRTRHESGRRVDHRRHRNADRMQPVCARQMRLENLLDRPLGCTVMNGVRLAQIQLGEAVVIVGAGLLGQLATAMAALSGAWPLIVIDVAEGRLEVARARGATHTIAADVGTAREAVREILHGRNADVVF